MALQLQEFPLTHCDSRTREWGGGRSPTAVLTSEQLQEHVDAVSADQVLGEEICRVLFTADLEEFDLLAAHFLLDPKALGIDVPQFTQPLSSTDSDSRRAVCPDTHGEFYADIAQQGLIP